MNIALFLSILIIFIGCDLSTNGIEWIGRKFKLSESVVGVYWLQSAQPSLRRSYPSSPFFHKRRERAQPLFSDGLR